MNRTCGECKHFLEHMNEHSLPEMFGVCSAEPPGVYFRFDPPAVSRSSELAMRCPCFVSPAQLATGQLKLE